AVGGEGQRRVGQVVELAHVDCVGVGGARRDVGDLVAAHADGGVGADGDAALLDHQSIATQIGRATHAQVVGDADVVAQADLYLAVGHGGDDIAVCADDFDCLAEFFLHRLAVAGLDGEALVGEVLLRSGQLVDVDGVGAVDAGRDVDDGLVAGVDAAGGHARAAGDGQAGVAQGNVRTDLHAGVVDQRIAGLDATGGTQVQVFLERVVNDRLAVGRGTGDRHVVFAVGQTDIDG